MGGKNSGRKTIKGYRMGGLQAGVSYQNGQRIRQLSELANKSIYRVLGDFVERHIDELENEVIMEVGK